MRKIEREREKKECECECVVFPVRNLASSVVVGANRPYLVLVSFVCVCVCFCSVGFFFFFPLAFGFLPPPPFSSSSVLDLSLEWLRNGDDDDDDVQGFVLDCAVIFRSSWLAPAAGFFEVKTDFCEVWERGLFRRGKFSG